MPSLEKCFNAVRKEIDPKQGESINRIRADINSGNIILTHYILALLSYEYIHTSTTILTLQNNRKLG